MKVMRPHNRKPDELRPLRFNAATRDRRPAASSSAWAAPPSCAPAASSQAVPPFLVGKGKGWLTAEYGMLPGSTNTRKPRDKAGKVDGRSVEIQRLIGRSLRAVVNLDKLGERTLWIDCDVLEADGGTRTASINGAFVAVIDALHSLKGHMPRRSTRSSATASPPSASACSNDVELLDLEYVEDRDAEVDLNLVMTGSGQFIEVQGTGEEATFSRSQLDRLLKLGKLGVDAITAEQKKALGASWPLSRPITPPTAPPRCRPALVERVLVLPAPQGGGDAQQQLGLVDRLGQEVVGAGLDGAVDVAGLVEGGDHEDGDVARRRVRREALAHLEAADLRHHDVEQDQVGLPMSLTLRSVSSPSVAVSMS